MRPYNKAAEFSKHVFLLLILLLAFLPMLLMVNISLKDNFQFSQDPLGLTYPFHWENYLTAWEFMGGTIFNTAFVAGMVTLLSLVLAIGGAFFFARYRMPGAKFLFFLFVVLMTYPTVANMVPMFSLLSDLELYNTHFALILPAVAGAQALNIFVLKNFMEEIPQDLFDAAEIDGASFYQQMRFIVLPHVSPVIGALGILLLVNQWNSFVAPLLYLRDDELQMLSVALLHFEGEYTKNWGALMAGYVIASLPLIVLFFFCMELFIKGLSSDKTRVPLDSGKL